jgi:hypothetical protein
MFGWIYTFAVILVLLVAAIFMRRKAAKLWWENVVILAIVGVIMTPLERVLTGVVSRFLPDHFSNGADGKDQIIYASIGATVLGSILVACAIWLTVKFVFRMFTRRKV